MQARAGIRSGGIYLVAMCVTAIMSLEARGVDNATYLISADGSGRATGYGGANKIITYDDKTHLTWVDSDSTGFSVQVKTLDRATGDWSDTYTVGTAEDNHGGAALTIDSQGYLHIAYYPHHSPMRYRKSVNPNDASAWEDETPVGVNMTYPTLITGPDDTLYLTARQSFGNEPWQASLFTKSPGGSWSGPTALIKGDETGYSQFAERLAWGPDHQTLHLTTRMYGENPVWSYKIGYMKSEDFGQTWETYDGSPITLPAVKSTIDTIAEADPALRSAYATGDSLSGAPLAVDANNVPWVLYSDLSPGGTIPHQAWLATPDGAGGWSKSLINDKIDVLPEDWGMTASGIHISEDGRLSLLLNIVNDPIETSPFGSNSLELVWAESSDGGQTFTSQIISPNDPDVPSWLPSLERPTGFNTVDDPAVLYTYGEKGGGLSDDLDNSVYYWGPAAGDVWNGVVGDVNQNGEFFGDGTGPWETDDVTAFIDGWNSRGLPGQFGTYESYTHGDLNFDGQTDLFDAYQIWWLLEDHGISSAALSRLLNGAPEPSTFVLALTFAVASLAWRNRRPVAA